MREIPEIENNNAENSQLSPDAKSGNGILDKALKTGDSVIAKIGKKVAAIASRVDGLMDDGSEKANSIYGFYEENLEMVRQSPSKLTVVQAMETIDEYEKQLNEHNLKYTDIGGKDYDPKTMREKVRGTYARAKQAQMLIRVADGMGMFDEKSHKEE